MSPNQNNLPREILNDSKISRLIEQALSEDIGMGDETTEAIIPAEMPGSAEIRVKETGILAGLAVATLVLHLVDDQIVVQPRVEDGALVEAGLVAANLHGPLGSILKAERTALNFLQRMSGIATTTRRYVEAVAGTRAKITDTRKTAPGLRIIDKLAVRLGGGINHRFGLDDMILIKDNHIEAAGSITRAVEQCLSYLSAVSYDLKIEVEARSLGDVKEVLGLRGVHRIMLDNFSVADTHLAVQMIRHVLEVEASGNVTLTNVRAIAETGVDFISVGALTHSPKALDISLAVVASPHHSHTTS